MAMSRPSLFVLVSVSLILLLLFAAPYAIAAGTPPQVVHQEALLEPILANLGFQQLAMAVPALLSDSPEAWAGPITVFAPSDDSIRSCGAACRPRRLLREHLVPGLFSHSYLSKLAFGTKLKTAATARCLNLTSASHLHRSSNSSHPLSPVKIFVDGVELTRPDLFNDGRVVIHGIKGFVSPLSPLSCGDHDLHTTASGPQPYLTPEIAGDFTAITRLMLRDAMIRLRDGGFSILALAMRIKYAELAELRNMTLFALDDAAIFAGGQAYVTSIRFHVVPDRLLTFADLARLPAGTVLPTLVRGRHLVVTHAAAPDEAARGPVGSGFRINYVPLKAPDVVYNYRIAVHAVFLPFPHLYVADMVEPVEDGEIFDEPDLGRSSTGGGREGHVPNAAAAAAPSVKCIAPSTAPAVDIVHHGL